MADKTPATTLKLPDDVKKRLVELEANLAESQKGVDVMKKLGMDVSKIEDQLVWAKEVRQTLLDQFG